MHVDCRRVVRRAKPVVRETQVQDSGVPNDFHNKFPLVFPGIYCLDQCLSGYLIYGVIKRALHVVSWGTSVGIHTDKLWLWMFVYLLKQDAHSSRFVYWTPNTIVAKCIALQSLHSTEKTTERLPRKSIHITIFINKLSKIQGLVLNYMDFY